jgi:diketogulonate reductase-like aldo/keto reductase
LDSLDLVQFYWHDYAAEKYVAAAQRLQELQETGLIRHIGVTNFDVPRLSEIVDAGVRIVSNQVIRGYKSVKSI